MRRGQSAATTLVVRALISFFTILPSGNSSLERAARLVYLLPLLGLLTGLPGAAIILLAHEGPSGVAATLALGAALLVAGFHHTDGVLDVGDALMVRGSAARRREVLKDARIGAGGVGALFLVYGPALAALTALAEASPALASLALFSGEVSARSVMVLMMAFGKPACESSSTAPFVGALRGWRRWAGVVISLVAPVVLYAAFGWSAALSGAAAAPLVALACLRVAGSAFGGINGDVVGASGEVGRAAALVVLSFTI